MVLPIYIYGREELRTPTHEVSLEDNTLPKLIDDMFETMYASDGVGLAAPQIGRSLRLFVVDASPLNDIYPETATFKRAFINPIILESSKEEVLMEEGCLSIPGVSEKVLRPKSVRVRYQTLDGRAVEELLEGFNARVFQHEYDHIEDVLFTDRISPLRKQLIKKKLNDLSRGKVRAGYRTVTK